MSFEDYIQEADKAEANGDIISAIGFIRQAMEINPNDALLLVRLGDLQEGLELYEDALKSFRLAIALNFGLSGAHSRLGCVALALGNFDVAESSLRESIKQQPTADRFVLLGDIQRSMGKDVNAEASFRNALQLNPGHEEAIYNLALLLRDKGDASGAEVLLRKAIEIDPEYAEAYRELGFTLRGQNRMEDAEQYLRQSIALDDSQVWAHVYLGELMERVGSNEEAEREYLRACEIDPTFALPHRCLGNLYATLDKNSDAEWHFQRAEELDG